MLGLLDCRNVFFRSPLTQCYLSPGISNKDDPLMRDINYLCEPIVHLYELSSFNINVIRQIQFLVASLYNVVLKPIAASYPRSLGT